MNPAPPVRTERRDDVALLVFDRPDQLNAMSGSMMAAITEALEAFEVDPTVAAIVLTGAGKAFMAGADIKEYAAFDAAGFRAFQVAGRRMYERIERNAKPVIAAVNGFALGGGFEMVLACDLVVARRGAKMGLPEVKLGLVPGGGGTQRLSARVGPNRSFELLATGGFRPAELFHEWGLVNRLVDGDPVDEAVALGRELAGQPADAMRALKGLARLAREAPLSTGLDAELVALERLYLGEEGQARIRAFAEKSAKPASEEQRS